MALLQRLVSPAILFYSARLPDHPGKWRVVDALLRASRLDALHRGREYVARRRGVWWKLDTACWVQRTVFYRGGWDDDEVRLVLALLPEDGVFVDVGAYFGWYSLVVARERPRARVLALEPVPASFARLEENRRANGISRVTALRLALGAAESTAEMALPPAANGGSAHLAAPAEGGARERVRVSTLDRVVADERLPRVDVVKVDVEGAEVEVLRGARRTLERFRPLLLVELNPSALAARGSGAPELLGELAALGYQACEVRPRGALAPFGPADLARPELERGYVNLLCRAVPDRDD